MSTSQVLEADRAPAVAKQAFVGRQPILDRSMEVYGHELLYRSGDGPGLGGLDGDQATSRVVLNTFLEFGLDRVVGTGRAFINVTRDFLLDDEPLPFPNERLVLEVLEDAEVDDELVAAVRSRVEEGFAIALDDFVYEPRWEPLLPLASIVKVEIPALGPADVESHVRLLRGYDLKLLAEKVETREEFERLHALGFDLFQGFFFARPQVVAGSRIPDNRLATLQLLAGLRRPDADVAEIERIVSRDVGLSYKLLRFINSAYFSLPRPVDSIRRAVVFLGLAGLKRIATLAAMAANDDKPSELLRVALVRARMCELLCERVGGADADVGFTVGLFSTLEALMDAPLPEILDRLPLADDVSAALGSGTGLLGRVLACTLSFERCDFDAAPLDGLPAEALAHAYTEAVEWSYEAGAGLIG